MTTTLLLLAMEEQVQEAPALLVVFEHDAACARSVPKESRAFFAKELDGKRGLMSHQ